LELLPSRVEYPNAITGAASLKTIILKTLTLGTNFQMGFMPNMPKLMPICAKD
jgi:hypothetical protein